MTLSVDDIKRVKGQISNEISAIKDKLENDFPGVTEGVATAIGAGTGMAGSLFILKALGVAGLSAPGITSGLAAAGALVGGGMAAGIGVLATPAVALGVTGYAVAKKRKNAKLAAALGEAIEKLYAIQTRLMENAEHFAEEIAGIKMLIEFLSSKRTGTTSLLPCVIIKN